MNLHIKICNAIIWLQVRKQLHQNEKVRIDGSLPFLVLNINLIKNARRITLKKLYNKHIDYYVKCMVEKYEYSKKLEKVKEKINIALYEKYYIDKENENTFQALINDYHTVDDLLKLVDEDQQILTMNNDEYFLKLKKYNRFLNISIILAIVSVVYFLQAVIYYKNNFIFLFLFGI